ncbi:MAG: ATP-binding protein [Phycisphaerae bacterium]
MPRTLISARDGSTVRYPPYILGAIFLVLATGSVAAAYSYYGAHEQHYRVGVERQLLAVVELKADELANWRAERLGNASAFFGNDLFSSLVRRGFENPRGVEAQSQPRKSLSQVQGAYAPARERGGIMVAMAGLLVLATGACIALIWWQQRLYVRRKTPEAAVALRASESQYRRLFETAQDGILILDAQTGKVMDVNPFLTKMLGFGREHFIGKTTSELGLLKDTLANQANFAELQQKGYIRYENLPLKTADHRQIDVEFISNVYRVDHHQVIQCNVRDITERKQAEKTLKGKTEELARKNEELARFIYTVSHDLKSPLVTISTFLGYLENDAARQDAKRMGKDVGYIRNAADKMSRLLDELLELSRVGLKMNPSVDVSLQTVAAEALALVAGRVAARGVQVQVTQEPVLLHGDRQRLVEVFQNLLDNAVKFMGDQPAPRIEIGTEQVGEETVLLVRDNGGGIDPRHQGRLFGLFEKLDPHSEGTGLGLSMVRRVVEVHGGRVWVESAGAGMGTTFRFTLAHTKRPAARSA